jgi:hypothetical protein
MSGYRLDLLQQGLTTRDQIHYLAKPFEAKTSAQVVRRCLDLKGVAREPRNGVATCPSHRKIARRRLPPIDEETEDQADAEGDTQRGVGVTAYGVVGRFGTGNGLCLQTLAGDLGAIQGGSQLSAGGAGPFVDIAGRGLHQHLGVMNQSAKCVPQVLAGQLAASLFHRLEVRFHDRAVPRRLRHMGSHGDRQLRRSTGPLPVPGTT